MNTDLEALGITCADLNIENAPKGVRILSCAVTGDTIEATILFWVYSREPIILTLACADQFPLLLLGSNTTTVPKRCSFELVSQGDFNRLTELRQC